MEELRINRKWMLRAIAGTLLVFFPILFADSATADTTYSLGGNLSSVFTASNPPSWDAAAGQGLAGAIGTCNPYKGTIATILSNLGTNAPSCVAQYAVAFGQSCPAGDTVTDSKLSCINYDPAEVNKEKAILKNAYCSAACKQAQLEQCKAEVDCIKSMATGLSAQAKSVGAVYKNAYAAEQVAFTNYTNAIDNRQKQMDAVNLKLKGDGTNPGLQKVKDQMDAMIQAMPAEIKGITNTQLSLVSWANQIDQSQKTLEISNTMSCLQNNQLYKCTTTDKQTRSATDALLCRFKNSNSFQKGANGYAIQADQTQKAIADSQADALNALLQQMSSQTPSGSQVPMTLDSVNQAGSQNQTAQGGSLILSKDDWKKNYLATLNTYKIVDPQTGASVGVGDQLSSAFDYCNSLAKSTNKNLEKQSTSDVSRARKNLLSAQNDLKASIQPLYQKYNSLYAQAFQSMTNKSVNLPTSTSKCAAATYSTQIQCLNNIQSEMTAAFSGSPGGGTITIPINGSDPKKIQNLSCTNISTCTAVLQEVQPKLKADFDKLTRDRDTMVTKSNSDMTAYTQKMAAQLNGGSAILNAKLKTLQSAMGNIGANMDIKFYSAQNLTPDKNGLNQPPNDPLALISKEVNPEMPDLSNFNPQLPANIESAAQLLDKYNEVDRLDSECKYQENKDLIQATGGMLATGCHDYEFCKVDSTTKLAQQITDVMKQPGLSQYGTQLVNGLDAACRAPQKGQTTSYSTMMASCERYHATLQSTLKAVNANAPKSRNSSGSILGR